ncbi:hypothetical protein E0Z10_g3250 [Xylaria hypoxylon]|uniref:Uncharacterized protein n=1 Tax=Xylaria hypoxylon TaxID=37992 RepID=A0A4Z0YNK1_9PEZI|nr:hypothetical protein E0Z10_g3250 [Xylaria hypoxylon]
MELLKELTTSEFDALREEIVEGIWLVEFKNGDDLAVTARGWALAIVTRGEVFFITPKIVHPTGPVETDFNTTKDHGGINTGFEKMVAVTAAGHGRRLLDMWYDVTVNFLFITLVNSGITEFKAINGRGLRYWICGILFLLAENTMEPTAVEYLRLKAIRLMRRCFNGGDTMEFMPIEKGKYKTRNLDFEASAALNSCDWEMAQLRNREGF